MAALDSYRSEHEKTITGKDKMIENLSQQLQQSEKSKVLLLSGDRSWEMKRGRL